MRFTAPSSRTHDQLRWFFTPEVGGVCLFMTLCNFAICQSWNGAWLMAIELCFWFCLARICNPSGRAMRSLWMVVLPLVYVTHIAVSTFVNSGDRGSLAGDILIGSIFALMVAFIALGVARIHDRPRTQSAVVLAKRV